MVDKISGLSDELLIEILYFLPTKVAVSTCILSKRWEFLWMWLPNLEFVTKLSTLSECERLRCFLDRNLPLHRAPIIESFCPEFTNSRFRSEDVKLWVLIAVSRQVAHLDISYSSYLRQPNIFPSSLYTCKSLEMLKLHGDILLDVPRMVCLPSLTILLLEEVENLDGKSLQQLLSICPALEKLLVDLSDTENMGKISIIAPFLQDLSLFKSFEGKLDGLVIDTPCLTSLKLLVRSDEIHSCLIENLPNLEEAHLDGKFTDTDRLIRSITSVKRLTICSEAVYGDGFVFNQLEHLKLCVGREISSNLLVRLLKDSPNLRELHLYEMTDHGLGGLVSWNEPSTVPDCMVSNLQTFNWTEYYGRPQEKDLAFYILKNARGLKTATISSRERFVTKLEMIKELSLSSRASTTCQLVFS